ncbi:MAG: CarD family transcriptional regulator [Brevinemataceae bacterium]
MFKKGLSVFYPFHGAGQIVDIEEKEVLGKTREYLIIEFPLTHTKVMLPVDNAENSGLRPLATEKMIKQSFDLLASEGHVNTFDWKQRYKLHTEMIKSGKILDIAEVIRNLHRRNIVKELSSTEKKLYNDSLDMLSGEIAVVLQKDSEDVRNEIESILKKHAPSVEE